MSPSVRVDASHLVGRVMRQGAYTNVLLAHARRGMDARDARLLSRLTYGAIRYLVRIDQVLAEASNRPLKRVESEVLDVLRVAAFELLFTDTPPHAAVDEGVTAVREVAGERAVAFANGVLRKVAAGERVADRSAGERDVPDWIRQGLVQAWGEEEAVEFLRASQQPAPFTVKSRFGPPPSGASAISGIEGAYEVPALPEDPQYLVTDPASVAVVSALDVRPGMTVLDVAAAPGGKTIQIADAIGPAGWLVAADRHARRLNRARSRARAHAVDADWLVADGRRPPFGSGNFDRILIDAPCTGLGTLRRRPEIRHRLSPASPGELAEIQRSMTTAALPLLKPGGRLVYSVCTVFPEETWQVVEELGGRAPKGLPGRPAPSGWLLAPHLTRTDGMYISVIEPS